MLYYKTYNFYVGPNRFVVRDEFLGVFVAALLLQLRWAGAHVLVWTFRPLWAFFSVDVLMERTHQY